MGNRQLNNQDVVNINNADNKENVTSVAEQDVRTIIASNQVVIFADLTCGYCQSAQGILRQIGIKFTTIYATPIQRQVLYEISGMKTVPNIWISGRFIGGCSDGPESWMGLTKISASGKIKELLK